MSGNLSLTERLEQKELEKMARNPYDPGLRIDYLVDAVDFSAFVFISDYLSISKVGDSIGEKFVRSLNYSLKVFEHMLMPQNFYNPYKKKAYEVEKSSKFARIGFAYTYDPTLFNKMINIHKSEEMTPIKVTSLAISEFVQGFLDYFNEKENPSQLIFMSKQEALKKAMARGDSEFVSNLHKYIDLSRNEDLSFGPATLDRPVKVKFSKKVSNDIRLV